MHAWLIRVSGVAYQVFIHKYDTGLLSFSVDTLCSQIEREEFQRRQMVSLVDAGVSGNTGRCNYSGRRQVKGLECVFPI